MKINMKGYEEWKEKARKEKTEISKMDLMKVCGRIASAAMKPEDKDVGTIDASIEMVKIIDEFFPEKNEEEPDAEKSAEKTALSVLEKLLFEQRHLAVTQYTEESSPEAYGRFKALQGLVMDAGLEEKYNFWKAVNGYE